MHRLTGRELGVVERPPADQNDAREPRSGSRVSVGGEVDERDRLQLVDPRGTSVVEHPREHNAAAAGRNAGEAGNERAAAENG